MGRIRSVSFEEAERKISLGEWQAHKFNLGVVITEIKQYETERILTVQLLGGEKFDEWKAEANEHLKKFGKLHGCVAIEALCRLGLEKKLAPIGWKRRRVQMRIEL